MRRLALYALSVAPAFALAASPATAGDWTAEPQGSELTFTFTQAGARASGEFGRFTTDFETGADGAPVALTVVVDVASLDTKDGERDALLRGADLFAVEHYPEARFESASIHLLGGSRYEATGKLTIRGVTRDVQLPFTLSGPAGGPLELAGELAIRRLDYGVGQGEWKSTAGAGNEVTVRYTVLLRASATLTQ